MKSIIALAGFTTALLVAGCASGNPAARTDYVDPNFASPAARRSQRAAEIRKLYPTLSEQQITDKVNTELPLTAAPHRSH